MKRQAEFIATISKLAKDLRTSKDGRPKKIEKLKAAINDSKLGLSSFQPIPLPLDARIMITGLDADKSTIFKSNLFPLKLQVKTTDGDEYPIIFKNGDDMRQDQLVLQLFTLMDRLLRKENLDLKLMPYKVLATTPTDGMVQFVPSQTVGSIASEYNGSLLAYLRQHHPDEGSVSTFGVKPEVLDTYVRSCGALALCCLPAVSLPCAAGYCVVTYLLGVGDRHLDNLLLSPDGHFFHGTPMRPV
jgi:phosphatidylinositol 3-kinase